MIVRTALYLLILSHWRTRAKSNVLLFNSRGLMSVMAPQVEPLSASDLANRERRGDDLRDVLIALEAGEYVTLEKLEFACGLLRDRLVETCTTMPPGSPHYLDFVSTIIVPFLVETLIKRLDDTTPKGPVIPLARPNWSWSTSDVSKKR